MSLVWRAGPHRFDLRRRHLVMGVLNITPDSFSDGGLFADAEAAVRRGIEMTRAGADLIDVGGESTRPGAEAVDDAEQIRRVSPVIRALARESNIPISIDTTSAAVASAAIGEGACVVNDISGLRHDGRLAGIVAAAGAGLVLMHMRGTPQTMQQDTNYEDLLGEIRGALRASMEIARSAGVAGEQIVLDPGIGFAKTAEQNIEILNHLDAFADLGRPILIGVSRKSFLGKITNRPAPRRLGETIAATILAAQAGARIHRVHDVEEVAAALAVYQATQGHQVAP